MSLGSSALTHLEVLASISSAINKDISGRAWLCCRTCMSWSSAGVVGLLRSVSSCARAQRVPHASSSRHQALASQSNVAHLVTGFDISLWLLSSPLPQKKVSERLVSPDPTSLGALPYNTTSSISPSTTSTQWPQFSHCLMCPIPHYRPRFLSVFS